MPRKLSSIAPDWWDYTTLDDELIRDVAKLTIKDIEQLARPGFRIVFYDTLEDFYLAEALEYIQAGALQRLIILAASAARSDPPNNSRSSRGS
jgi:hypothetical protein